MSPERTNRHRSAVRRIDFPSAILTFLGVAFGAIAYWLITAERVNVIVVVPSIVAVTVGLTHLLKWEAPRE